MSNKAAGRLCGGKNRDGAISTPLFLYPVGGRLKAAPLIALVVTWCHGHLSLLLYIKFYLFLFSLLLERAVSPHARLVVM